MSWFDVSMNDSDKQMIRASQGTIKSEEYVIRAWCLEEAIQSQCTGHKYNARLAGASESNNLVATIVRVGSNC